MWTTAILREYRHFEKDTTHIILSTQMTENQVYSIQWNPLYPNPVSPGTNPSGRLKHERFTYIRTVHYSYYMRIQTINIRTSGCTINKLWTSEELENKYIDLHVYVIKKRRSIKCPFRDCVSSITWMEDRGIDFTQTNKEIK